MPASVCVVFLSLQQRKLDQKVRGALRRRGNYVRLLEEFKVAEGLTVLAVVHFSWTTSENKMLNWNSPMKR